MGNVRALVEDALPARLPGARVAAERDEIIVAVPGGRARVSLVPLLGSCLDQRRVINRPGECSRGAAPRAAR
ncbi:hypothetical protein AB0F68_12730 [Micromonospora sp. NPDC023966]|uniref:hypothetical protein n=1 Tax=Micromonospora sp. NPDC023966 TaxID=3154699 RepID=UPI0033DA1FF1